MRIAEASVQARGSASPSVDSRRERNHAVMLAGRPEPMSTGPCLSDSADASRADRPRDAAPAGISRVPAANNNAGAPLRTAARTTHRGEASDEHPE